MARPERLLQVITPPGFLNQVVFKLSRGELSERIEQRLNVLREKQKRLISLARPPGGTTNVEILDAANDITTLLVSLEAIQKHLPYAVEPIAVSTQDLMYLAEKF
jgi:hypothetical protein